MTVRRARSASRFTVAQLNFRRESLRKALSRGSRRKCDRKTIWPLGYMSQKLDVERFLPRGTPATVATGSNGRFAGPRPCARSPAGPISLGLRKFLEQLLSDAAGPRPLSGGQSVVRRKIL